MVKYQNYRYIFPPRPKNNIPESDLDFWDNGALIGQPKMNGSNATLYLNKDKQIVMNRHNQRLTNFNLSTDEINNIYRGSGWMVINGEYMNKSKVDENNQLFNHKFVIFDILALNDEYMVGYTFEQRISLLDSLYGKVDSEKDYLYRSSENVYRVRSYDFGFSDIFSRLTKIDMVEGLVMKRKNAKLEIGATENNNFRGQIKCRKTTRNYKY